MPIADSKIFSVTIPTVPSNARRHRTGAERAQCYLDGASPMSSQPLAALAQPLGPAARSAGLLRGCNTVDYRGNQATSEGRCIARTLAPEPIPRKTCLLRRLKNRTLFTSRLSKNDNDEPKNFSNAMSIAIVPTPLQPHLTRLFL